MLKRNISVQEETYKVKLAARRERLRLKRSGMASDDDSFFGGFSSVGNKDQSLTRKFKPSLAKDKSKDNLKPAGKRESNFLFPYMDESGDMRDISGIAANDLSACDAVEISILKNIRSEKKLQRSREGDNIFDNSVMSMDEQELEEYNAAQKEIYRQTLTKLESLQQQQEVSKSSRNQSITHF